MYSPKISMRLLWLSTLGLSSAAVLSNRASLGSLESRTVIQGWSLQSSTCPAASTSCGGNACCPSNLFCIAAADDEVTSCCTTNSACRGAIEGQPICADSSWSLWKGFQSNDFCCEVGLIGVYSSTGNVAGTCASSLPAGSTSAVLMSAGSGSPTPAPSPSTTSTPAAPTTTTVTTSTIPGTTPSTTPGTTPTTTSSTGPAPTTSTTGKPVFFHYLIGTLTDSHCNQDVLDAQALGADAFALNLATDSTDWAIAAVTSLFSAANAHGFKLFFSFDMTGFSDPDMFTSFLLSWVTNDAYYLYDGLPLVSTFNGGASGFTFGQDSVNDGWKVGLLDVMSAAGHPIYFVPAFQDVTITSSFFDTYPSLNGALNWNAWPQNTQGDIVVPTADDLTLQLAARAAGKTFLMGVSPLQFKHIDSGDNYYRRGEENLEFRFGQVLDIQPDFIELITWNDSGESHYMGNIWPEPIAGSVIGAYSLTYDHTGYWQILPAFIKAWKAGETTTANMFPTNGAIAQGTFWHHTLLAAGTCPSDPLGPPMGQDTVEDKVTSVVLVAEGQTGLTASITSGTAVLGTQALVAGFNAISFEGMTTGQVSMKVTNSAGATVISGVGPIDVVSTSSLCNYNFQVVGLA